MHLSGLSKFCRPRTDYYVYHGLTKFSKLFVGVVIVSLERLGKLTYPGSDNVLRSLTACNIDICFCHLFFT
jgi:hypothetical protein